MSVNRKAIAVKWLNSFGIVQIDKRGSIVIDSPADDIREKFFAKIKASGATILGQTETGIRFKYPEELCGIMGLGVYAMSGGRCIIDVQTF